MEIDDWDVTSKYPRGHYLRTLGAVGDIEVCCKPTLTIIAEMMVLMVKMFVVITAVQKVAVVTVIPIDCTW